jgi:hypothetical protein
LLSIPVLPQETDIVTVFVETLSEQGIRKIDRLNNPLFIAKRIFQHKLNLLGAL